MGQPGVVIDVDSDGLARSVTPSLPRRFLQNAASTYGALVVLGLQVVVVTPLLVHGLGPELYGVWAVVASLGLMISLLDLGLGSATVRYVAHYEGLKDRANVVRTVAVSFWILAVLSLIALLLAVPLAPVFAKYFSAPGHRTDTAVLVILTAASVALTFMAGAFGGCFAGLQYHSVNNAFNAGIAIAETAGFALVLGLGGGLIPLGVVLLVVSSAGLMTSYLVLRRFLPELRVSWRSLDRAWAKRVLGMTTWVSSIQLATIIRYRIDTIVVGAVAGIRAAGVYSVGQLVFVAVNRFIQPAVTGFFPFAAELAGRRDSDGLRRSVVVGTRLALAVAGALSLPVLVFAAPLISAWVGPGFHDARLVVIFLVSSLLLGALTRAGFAMLDGSGQYRVKAYILGAEAIVNVTLSVVLGVVVGPYGVALATLIATAALSTAVGLPYICRTYHLNIGRFLVGIGRAYLPAFGIAFSVAWLVYPHGHVNLFSLFLRCCSVALSYLATLLVTGLDSYERAALRRLVRPGSARLLRLTRVAARRVSGD